MSKSDLVTKALSFKGASSAVHNVLIDYYNDNCLKLVKPARRYRMTERDNWCAMFTSAIAHQCGLSPDAFPYEVSVGEQVKIARERGAFQQSPLTCEAGDLIIYNWNGDSWPDHVGFIQSIKNGVITTVEGNYHGTVGVRNIAANSKFIFGIIKL